MTETLLGGRVVLHCGDCRAVLATLAPESIDAVVTDPPYALAFMGKSWDHAAVAFDPALWVLVHKALRPGGHLLAMGGTRTFHRLACAIEDAGFEIRDTISWLYGSGFPKSHDVSKGIDRAAGAEREKIRHGNPRNPKTTGGGRDGMEGATRPWIEAAMVNGYHELDGPEPITDAARQWQGWGTALKPACELIVLARKPLSEGTVAANVLRWGTGAINIGACRVAADDVNTSEPYTYKGDNGNSLGAASERLRRNGGGASTPLGRWPANVAHDGSDEVVAAFPDSGPASDKPRHNGAFDSVAKGHDYPHVTLGHADDGGSAARFFYTAKADADDRLGSKHPTVKPLDLMQWLVRMVTPKGGTVLDPFAGTGTTGEAAWREGAHAVLIEAEPEYQADIRRRMALAMAGPDERVRESIKAKNLPRDDGPLFSEWQRMWAKPFDFSQEPKGNPG